MHCQPSGSSSCDPSWPSAWKLTSPCLNSGHKPTVPGTSNRMVWSGNCKRGWMGRVPNGDAAMLTPPESPWPCSTGQLGISPLVSFERRVQSRVHVIARAHHGAVPFQQNMISNNSKHGGTRQEEEWKSVVSWIIPSKSCMAIGIRKIFACIQTAGCRAFWISMRFGWMRWPTNWPTRCSKFSLRRPKRPGPANGPPDFIFAGQQLTSAWRSRIGKAPPDGTWSMLPWLMIETIAVETVLPVAVWGESARHRCPGMDPSRSRDRRVDPRAKPIAGGGVDPETLTWI